MSILLSVANKPIMLSVIMLIDIMLSVVAPQLKCCEYDPGPPKPGRPEGLINFNYCVLYCLNVMSIFGLTEELQKVKAGQTYYGKISSFI